MDNGEKCMNSLIISGYLFKTNTIAPKTFILMHELWILIIICIVVSGISKSFDVKKDNKITIKSDRQ